MDSADKNKHFMLIVDHNVDDCFHTAMLLKHLGYTIFTAPGAQKALEIMSVSPPLAVFADASDAGTALHAGIKKNPQFAEIPLILLSTAPNAALEGRVRTGEFAGFFRKPVDADQLFQFVESAVFKGPRKNIRIITALRAEVSGNQGSIEGLIANISESGMFFRTLDSHPAGSRLTVNFALKHRIILLEAEVVYSCTFDEGPFREPGMGIKFVKIKPEDQAFIKEFIGEDIAAKVAR